MSGPVLPKSSVEAFERDVVAVVFAQHAPTLQCGVIDGHADTLGRIIARASIDWMEEQVGEDYRGRANEAQRLTAERDSAESRYAQAIGMFWALVDALNGQATPDLAAALLQATNDQKGGEG